MKLVEKLNRLSENLDYAELDNYKLLLGMAAGGLAPRGHLPVDPCKIEAFNAVLKCLSKIQPTGILWHGRPDFITDKLLKDLQKESTEIRKIAEAQERYFLGCGGKLANKLATSDHLVNMVQEYAPQMIPTGIASYLFYDKIGCGLDPHIDTEIFTLNMILMLKHEYDIKPASRLWIYPVNEEPKQFQLLPGECLLLYAGGMVHSRDDIKDGENISLLTIGFSPSK